MLLHTVTLLFSSFALAFARTTKCLSEGHLALSIDGSPTPSSTEILGILRKLNITALFNLDSEKLSQPDAAEFIRRIEEEGHLMGLSLPAALEINNLSEDLLRGAVEKRLRDFEGVSGKRPVFLRVPSDTNDSKVVLLEAAGFLVVSPGFDMTGVWSGNCEKTYNASVSKWALESSSLVVSIPDVETGCTLRELNAMLNSTKESGIKIVRMDHCLNLKYPYQQQKLGKPVNFSLYEGQQAVPTSASEASVNLLSANAASNIAKQSLRYTPLIAIFALPLMFL